MKSSKLSIPIWRVVTAFVVAPMPVALVFALATAGGDPAKVARFFFMFVTALVVGAYPWEILMGVPAFLFLRRRLNPTLLNCAAIGAVIAVLPWIGVDLLSTPEAEFGGGHYTVLHYHRTLWGWQAFASGLSVAAAIGAVTGIVFWLVAAAGIKAAGPSVESTF